MDGCQHCKSSVSSWPAELFEYLTEKDCNSYGPGHELDNMERNINVSISSVSDFTKENIYGAFQILFLREPYLECYQ